MKDFTGTRRPTRAHAPQVVHAAVEFGDQQFRFTPAVPETPPAPTPNAASTNCTRPSHLSDVRRPKKYSTPPRPDTPS